MYDLHKFLADTETMPTSIQPYEKITEELVSLQIKDQFQLERFSANPRAVSKLLRHHRDIKTQNVFIKRIFEEQSKGFVGIVESLGSWSNQMIAEIVNRGGKLTDYAYPIICFRHCKNGFRQSLISKIHCATFKEFSTHDLKQPYCFAYRPLANKRNFDDLKNIYSQYVHTGRPDLQPFQVLFLDWVFPHLMINKGEVVHVFDFLIKKMNEMNEMNCQEENEAAVRSIYVRYQCYLGHPNEYGRIIGLPSQTDIVANGSHAHVLEDRDRISSKFFRSIQFLTCIAKRKLMPSSQSDLKIAVCVSGQLRGFEDAYKTWKNTILKGMDVDIYVHTWKSIGSGSFRSTRSYVPWNSPQFTIALNQLCLNRGYKNVSQRYVNLFSAFKVHSTITEGYVQDVYHARRVVVEDETQQGFRDYSNQDKMHYKIWSCNQLVKESGRHYDLIVRIRPDRPIRFMGFDWNRILADSTKYEAIFADSGLTTQFGTPIIGDQIAIGAPRFMNCYSDVWKDQNRFAKLGLYDYPGKFRGHRSLAYHCWINGITVATLNIISGKLSELNKTSAKDLAPELIKDFITNPDTFDKTLLKSVLLDLQSQDPRNSLIEKVRSLIT